MKKLMKIHILVITVLIINSASLFSAPLQLSDEPLFINQSVPPALAVTFDDSGSMAWSYMPDSRDFDDSIKSFASSDYNLIYYNPTIDYLPPVDANGTPLPNANFNSAKIDGYYTNGTFASTVDLDNNYEAVSLYQPFYNDPPDPAGTSGGITAGANGGSYNIVFAHAGRSNTPNKAYYYTWSGAASASLNTRLTSSNYQRHDISGSAQKQNFANWFSYYNTRSKLAKAAVSQAFANFGPDFKIDWQQLNESRFSQNSSINLGIFDSTHRQNFYDWLFQIPSFGSTPFRRATMEAGELFSNGDAYLDANYPGELSCQQNFHIAISDGSWNDEPGILGNVDKTGTTLPPLPDGSIVTFDPQSFPDKMYADQNDDSLADTAFHYWSTDLRPNLGNNVPQFIDDYTDSDGDVVTVNSNQEWWQNEQLFWNPKNDPANWQHMVNFNVGLGIEGTLDQVNDLSKIRKGQLVWPNTADICINSNGTQITCRYETCANSNFEFSPANCLLPLDDILLCYWYDYDVALYYQFNCSDRKIFQNNPSAERVDDVWHASLNSRGKYFSAKDPNELSTALYNVVSNIIKRQGRASAGSISSSIISDGSLTFKTGYDTSDWSGFVIASPLNTDGTVGAVEWDASCKLTGGFCPSMNTNITASNSQLSRKIITYFKSVGGSGYKHLFSSASMNTVETTRILNSAYFQSTIASGNPFSLDDVVRYVRGDRSLENQNGGSFRNRRNLLGDVVHSPATIIRGPAASYNDNIWSVGSPEEIGSNNSNGYNDFRDANRTRRSVILVGANDGMVHAFDAGLDGSTNGGDELWAFLPSESLKGLSEFANPLYKHKSYVDASPFVKDAFINNNWSTVAVGGLRKGGRLFYALDLGTTPSSVPDVLWEFSDADDADMGYSYAGAVITRVIDNNSPSTAKWIALLPNGYDSANQRSVLYAIDLATGELLHKWNSGVGSNASPNGMGPPVAADFVVTDVNDPSITYYGADQATDYAYAGDLAGNLYRFDMQEIFSVGTLTSTPDILYSGSTTNAITVAPRIFTPDDGTENIVVIFGTGKYIELPDRVITGSTTQYIFGLKDANTLAATYSKNSNRIVNQFVIPSADFLSRTLTNNPVNTLQSWKLQLPEPGERIVNSLGRNNNAKLLTAATIIPNGNDPCLPGGESWLMIINSNTGGTPSIGHLFNDSTSDGYFVDQIVLGFNYLTIPGGEASFINIDTTGSTNGSGEPPVELSRTSRWSRRSWHRLIFD